MQYAEIEINIYIVSHAITGNCFGFHKRRYFKVH